jgi:hypothetical protein
MSTETMSKRFRVGDPVRLKDTDLDMRGDVWQLRTGAYLVVRWQDACRTTHSETAIEYDQSSSRADWSRNLSHEDRQAKG